jgi:hypothetical protein
MTGVTRKSLVAISLGALFLTGLSFAGKFLALGDTLAVVRLQLVLVLAFGAVLLFWAGARAVAAASLIGVVIGLGSILPGYFAQGEECRADCYVLYQKNLLSRAWPRYPLADEIIASSAAFVTLQEVSAHKAAYDQIADATIGDQGEKLLSITYAATAMRSSRS